MVSLLFVSKCQINRTIGIIVFGKIYHFPSETVDRKSWQIILVSDKAPTTAENRREVKG